MRWLGNLILGLASAWAVAALYIDVPVERWRLPAAILYAAGFAAAIWFIRNPWVRWAIWAGGFIAVLIWWLSLQPSHDRKWQADADRLPAARVDGELVTIENVRNFEYLSEFNYIPHWETRVVDLSKLRGVDLVLTDWGAPYIAHLMASFVFGDGSYLAVSIEARKELGENYSALLGFFRQYELMYLIADERDVVRLRTNYRQGESVYLYRTAMTPADARRLFLQYMRWANALRERPEWYNALTANCASAPTSYLLEERVGGLSRWDPRTLLNGKSDEMLYELGDLVTDGLTFEELRRRALINPVAKAADTDPEFSRRIREGGPGFGGR